MTTNQTYEHGPGLRANSTLDAALGMFTRLVFGVVVMTLAARMFQGHVEPYEATILGGALAVAAGFGLVMGLLAGAIALMAANPAWGAQLLAADLSSRDLIFAAVFGVTLAGVGLAADAARRRDRLARAMPVAGRFFPSAQLPERARRSFELATPLPGIPFRFPVREETGRAIAGFALGLAGVATAVAFHRQLDPVGAIALALAPALLAAEWTSAACGLMIAGLAASVLAGLYPGAGTEERLSGAVGVILVAALGWRIGALAEDARRERDARETLARAGSQLSDSGDEAAIRAALAESLRRIDPNAKVEIRDETGALTKPALQTPSGGGADAWRVRRLFADGREVGDVRWRFSGANTRTADEAAAALIDMGASAIVRARLAVEKTEMEYSARAEQLRTILLDAVSHHFRSPLAGILGSVTSILGLPQPHEPSVDRQFLLIIKEQANRLNRYVDNFLSLARLEAGAIELNPSDVNLEMLIYDVWDSFGASGGARRYLQVDLEVETVRSDSGLLTQVFGNVLENAIKYSPEESLVTVRGRHLGDKLLIEVIDQGCGAPDAALDRMFERFHRVHVGETPGMGLGLYITRSLVETLGGRISARNRDDGKSGLVMSIGLPLTAAGS